MLIRRRSSTDQSNDLHSSLRSLNNNNYNADFSSILPNEWYCPRDSFNIQCDGLNIRSSPSSSNSNTILRVIWANKSINISNLLPIINRSRILETRPTLAPPSLSHQSSSSSVGGINYVYYFEVFLISGFFSVGFDITEDRDVAQSTTSSSNNLGPGISPDSIGLNINGDLWISGVNFPNFTQPFQPGDTIGCGVTIGNNPKYFFTRNGYEINTSAVTCSLSSTFIAIIPSVGISSIHETVIRSNFGAQSDHHFMWRGNTNVRIISSSNFISAQDDINDTFLQPDLIRGHTISGAINYTNDDDYVPQDMPLEEAQSIWDNCTLPNDNNIPSLPALSRTSGDALVAQNMALEPHIGRFGLMSQALNAIDAQDSYITNQSPKDDDTKALDLNDIKDMARELRSATFSSDVHRGAVSQLVDVCKSNLEQLNATIQRATTGEDSVHELGELIAVHDLVTDAIEAAESKKNETVSVASYSEDRDVMALLCRLRTKQRHKAVWGLLRLTKRGLDNERCHEVLTAGGMQSLLTLFETSPDDVELMIVSALTVVYLLPALLESDVQASSSIYIGVIKCLEYLIESSRTSIDIDISLSEIRTASAFTMTNLWFKVLEPKLQSSSELALLNGTMNTPSGDDDDPFSSSRFIPRRRSSLSSHGEDVDTSVMIDNFTALSISAAESELSRQDGQEAGHDMNVYFEFALIVESICAVEYSRPMAMSKGVLKLLVRWLQSPCIDLERPAANALRNLTLTQDSYVAGWVHSVLLHDNALHLIVRKLESSDSQVRLAMAEIISSLTVAPHTRAGVVQANGVKYLVQLLGSVDIAHDEALALAAGKALLRLAMGSPLTSSKEDCIDDIIDNGALNTLVSMAKSKSCASIRFLSAKIIRIISEECSGHLDFNGKERHLCDAGAVSALGKMLYNDINFIRSSVENNLALSDTSDLVNDSLSNDFLTSKSDHSSDDTVQEIRYVLRGLVNILYTSSDPTAFVDTQLMACAQLISSGGIREMLWIASLKQDACATLEIITREPRFCHDIQVDSCKILSSICSLLLSSHEELTGIAKWAPYVSSALVSFLRSNILCMIPDVCVDALQGLVSLADCEPMKTRIIDEFMPQLLTLHRHDNRNVCDAAARVCLSLGFNQIETGLVNDAHLLGDQFTIRRSRLIQSLVRDEIRHLLREIWAPALKANKHRLQNDTNEERSYDSKDIGALFPFLIQEKDSLESRDKFRHQFKNVYDCHSKSSTPPLSRSSSSFGRRQKMKRTMYRRSSYNEGREEELDQLWSMARSTSTGIATNRMGEISEHVLSDFVGAVNPPSCEDDNFLESHQYPLNSAIEEKDWVMEHCQAIRDDDAYSPWLSDRGMDLLRVCFPSKLIRDQVIPLNGFDPDASFNFRALTMPSGRYYSFRREGQLLSRECENVHHSEQRPHYTLCFSDSTYAGEFAESLLQALVMCPIIQGLSFSNEDFEEENALEDSSRVYEGTELLPFLVRAVPSSVNHLTFDNALSNSAALSLTHILKSVYDEDGDEDTAGSSKSISVKRSFHSLAIINSPHINQSIFTSLCESLGGLSSPLQFLRTLDLSGNLLGDTCAATVLSIALSPSSSMTIECLDLSRNSIGDGSAVTSVFQYYASINNEPKLKVLNLAQNEFGEGEVAYQVAASIVDVLSNTTSIDLSGNGLSGSFLTALGACSAATIGNPSHECNMVNLDISGNHFSSSSINGFLTKLHQLSTTVSMKMSFVNLDENEPLLAPNQQMVLNELLSANRQRYVARHLKKLNSSSSQSESDSDTKLSSISDITGEKSDPKKINPPEGITVLFSAPLVWRDSEDDFHPIEQLDFAREKSLLWQCFSEASRNIDLSYDNATTDRLQAVMTKGCKALHFSGHGHPHSLTFEDGSGGIHWFSVDQLKALISGGMEEGKPPFGFVFVSACHSALAGQTFVDSGVPHVVCCQQESQLMDGAALSFTRAFYLALAFGKTLKDSFEIGKQAVLSSATVPNADEEMKKFMLLPEDGVHDIPIFTAEQVPEWPLPQNGTNTYDENISLPTPPQGFLGREIDMYQTLNSVLNRRFVNIVGPSGMGRSSLAAALCHYINERKSTLLFDDIYYIKLKRPTIGKLSTIVSLHNQLVSAGRLEVISYEGDLDEIIQDILTSLKRTQSLLVFDEIENLEGSTEAQDLHYFLGQIFDHTNDVHVLVTSNKSIGLGGDRLTVGESVHELGPLSFRNTVKLFAYHCPHLHSSRERKDLLDELTSNDRFAEDDEISKKIKSILGGGIPAETFAVAYEMSSEDFQELKGIPGSNEVNENGAVEEE